MAENILNLDAGEKGIVGGMTITNVTEAPIELLVEGEGPVLREKRIIKVEDAATPSLKIYYLITTMYLNPASFEENYESLLKLSRELVTEVPSTGMIMADIGECVIEGDLRGAHEKCFELLRYEAYLEQVVAGDHGPTVENAP